MQPYLEELLKALQDPQINGFPVMVPEHKNDVISALAGFPDAKYVSEWRYAWGRIVYRYHVHNARRRTVGTSEKWKNRETPNTNWRLCGVRA